MLSLLEKIYILLLTGKCGSKFLYVTYMDGYIPTIIISGPATVAEVPNMECFICNRKYHVESEMRVAIIRGFLSSASTRRNC